MTNPLERPPLPSDCSLYTDDDFDREERRALPDLPTPPVQTPE